MDVYGFRVCHRCSLSLDGQEKVSSPWILIVDPHWEYITIINMLYICVASPYICVTSPFIESSSIPPHSLIQYILRINMLCTYMIYDVWICMTYEIWHMMYDIWRMYCIPIHWTSIDVTFCLVSSPRKCFCLSCRSWGSRTSPSKRVKLHVCDVNSRVSQIGFGLMQIFFLGTLVSWTSMGWNGWRCWNQVGFTFPNNMDIHGSK